MTSAVATSVVKWVRPVLLTVAHEVAHATVTWKIEEAIKREPRLVTVCGAVVVQPQVVQPPHSQIREGRFCTSCGATLALLRNGDL